MQSLINKTVGKAYNKLGKMNDLLNGPDPRFVSYRENGKDKKIENLDLSAEHCHSFIGKMEIDGSGTYSDDVITALLKYFFDHTKKGEKVVVELANKVSELLNGEKSMEGNMKYDEQKMHIFELAKQLDKKRFKDLEIIDIQDNNKRLFEVLENEGINGLDNEGTLPVLKDQFDSLDIAKRLYNIAKKDQNYLEEIKNLKPKDIKEIPGDSDYYGLVEMAIRINALLHGINLQGGVARQKKYDDLLMKHINPYVKDFPSLSDFQKFCWDRLKGETFKGLYFDTEGSEKLINKMNEKNQLKSKTRNALLLALGLGIGIGATNLSNNYIQYEKQKKATQETIKEIFENKKATRSGDYGYGEYTGKEKIEKINEYVKSIYNRFLFRYGSIGKIKEKEFKSKIIDCLNNQKLLSELGSDFSYDKIALEDIIIDDYLIPQNIGELKMNKVPVHPYESLIPYTNEFINTVLLLEDFEIASDSTQNVLDDKRGVRVFKLPIVKDIGGFSSKVLTGKSGYPFYKNKFAVVNHNNKRYIVSSPSYVDKLDENEVNIYSTNKARDLAVDFLEQTNPILNILMDQYLIRYASREEPGRYNSEGPEKSTIGTDTELLLLRGFLKKGLLEKIGKNFSATNKLEKINQINEFLDNFIAENRDIFKRYNNEINPNLIPNGFFQEYEDAMENVIKYGDNIDSRLPVTDFGKNNTVNHIGKYQASNGKIYNVGSFEKNGKRYLLADELGSPNYGKISYGPREGRIVAIDYMEQAKPIIKELLNIYSFRYFGGKIPAEKQLSSTDYIFDIYAKMKEMIIADFISNGTLKKIGGVKLTDIDKSDLIKYIDNFVEKEKSEFMRLSGFDDGKINPGMTPNYFLSRYEGSMQNTIANGKKIYLSNYLSSLDKVFGTIVKYLSSDGKEYMVWETNINGKNYLCAEEEGIKADDVLACGKIVAEDYFKTMNKQ